MCFYPKFIISIPISGCCSLRLPVFLDCIYTYLHSVVTVVITIVHMFPFTLYLRGWLSFIVFHIVMALVNKHYSTLLKAFVEHFNDEKEKILPSDEQLKSSFDYNLNLQMNKESIFNMLVNQLVSPDHKMTPIDFCGMLLITIGDLPVVKELKKG